MGAERVVLRFYHARNAHDLDGMMALVGEGIVNHAPAGMPDPPGKEGVRQVMAAEVAAFPDHHAQVQEVVADGDRVVVLAQMTGTHEGTFAGLPPTRRRFDVRAFQLFRVEGGLIVEHWGLFDRLALMEQLGVFPAPHSTAAPEDA